MISPCEQSLLLSFSLLRRRKGAPAWIASTPWSHRSPNFRTSQAFFLSSNGFSSVSMCLVIKPMVTIEPAVPWKPAIAARSGILGLGSRLYPGYMQRILNKDLIRFIRVRVFRERQNRTSNRKALLVWDDIYFSRRIRRIIMQVFLQIVAFSLQTDGWVWPASSDKRKAPFVIEPNKYKNSCDLFSLYSRPILSILGDPGAVSRDETRIENFTPVPILVSSRLTAPGSPRMFETIFSHRMFRRNLSSSDKTQNLSVIKSHFTFVIRFFAQYTYPRIYDSPKEGKIWRIHCKTHGIFLRS